MARYKVDLVAKLVGFHEIEIEADSEYDARQAAFKRGQTITDMSDWDIQYVDYHASTTYDRNGPVTVYDVSVNEIHEIK